MVARLLTTSLFIFFAIQDVQPLKCYKCESFQGLENKACINGEGITGEAQGFPTQNSMVLCYKFKGTSSSGREFYARDIREKANEKYNGKCVETKDMAAGEYPKDLKGLYCFCNTDLCNKGLVKPDAGGSTAVQGSLYLLVGFLALNVICIVQF